MTIKIIAYEGLFTEPPTLESRWRAWRTACMVVETVRGQLREYPRATIAVADEARAAELRKHFTPDEVQRIDFSLPPPAPVP